MVTHGSKRMINTIFLIGLNFGLFMYATAGKACWGPSCGDVFHPDGKWDPPDIPELNVDIRGQIEVEAETIARAQGNPDIDTCKLAVAAGIGAYVAKAGLMAGPWGAALGGFLGGGGGLLVAESACKKVYN